MGFRVLSKNRSSRQPVSGNGRLIQALGTVLFMTVLFAGLMKVATLFGYQVMALVCFCVLLMVSIGLLSFKFLVVPFYIWLFAVTGFRQVLFITAPGLPDIAADRVTLVWLLAVITLRFVLEGRTPKRPAVLDTLIVLHTLYLLASTFFLNMSAFNLWTKAYLMPCMAYFFGKMFLNDSKRLDVLFKVLFVMGLYHSFTAVFEHFRWNSLIWPQAIVTSQFGWFYGSGRARGIFLQPAVLGIMLGFFLCVQFYYYTILRKAVLRIFVLGSMAMTTVALLYTYTRGNWVAAVAGVFGLVVFGWRSYSGKAVQLLLIATIIAGSGMLGLQSDRFLQERLANENTIMDRANVFTRAYRMFLDNPIVGVGYKNFIKRSADYLEPVNVPFLGLVKAGQAPTCSPHDIFMGAICEEGIAGMSIQVGIYLLAAILLLRMLRLGGKGDYGGKYQAPVIAGIWCCYMMGGLTFDYRFFSSLNVVFYLLLGAVAAYMERVDMEGEAPVQQSSDLTLLSGPETLN